MASHRPKVIAQQQTDPKIERRLDDELEQTFPASDALQITVDPPPALKDQRRRTRVETDASR